MSKVVPWHGSVEYANYDKRFAKGPRTNYPNGLILFDGEKKQGYAYDCGDADQLTVQALGVDGGSYVVEGKLVQGSDEWVPLVGKTYGSREVADSTISDNGIYVFDVRSLAEVRVSADSVTDTIKSIVCKIENWSK